MRRMADEAFRAEQWRRRYEEHVAPVNALVDDLNTARPPGRGPVPYVPPHYGGARAGVLSLLSNPGPRAGGEAGSGFVSCENTAPSSVRLARAYAAAGLDQQDATVWNAFPWYVHDALGGRLTAAMLTAGVEPLRRLLGVLPALRVVVLHGGHARGSWARLLRAHGDAVGARGLAVLPTWHPSNQVFAVPPPVRAEREQDLVDAYVEARSLLGPAA